MSCSRILVAVSALIAVSTGIPLTNPLKPTKSLLVSEEKNLLKPYEFGFRFGDGLGMNQHRKEVADENGVKGSYGYIDASGVSRVVEYTADEGGYKAIIRTNEPGIVAQNAANVVYHVQSPPEGLTEMYFSNELNEKVKG